MGKIPKILHQIWFQGWDEVPLRYRLLSEHIRSLHNPDWTYMFWCEDSMNRAVDTLSKFNPAIAETYYGYEYMISKIDFAKYVILYIHGGVYVDMDTYGVQRLDPLFDTPDLTVSETNNFFAKLIKKTRIMKLPFVNNAIIGSQQGDKLMMEIIENCINRKNSKFWHNYTLYVLDSTGPWMVSNALNKTQQPFKILDAKYLHSQSEGGKSESLSNKELIDKNVYAVHLYDKSWDDSKGAIIPLTFGISIIIILYTLLWLCSGSSKSQ